MADDKKPENMQAPSEEHQATVHDIVSAAIQTIRGQRGLGLVRLKHKATGVFHTMLVIADPDSNMTFPCAVMIEDEHPLRAYELPPGIEEVDLNPEKKFESAPLDPNDPVAIADAMLASVFGKKPN